MFEAQSQAEIQAQSEAEDRKAMPPPPPRPPSAAAPGKKPSEAAADTGPAKTSSRTSDSKIRTRSDPEALEETDGSNDSLRTLAEVAAIIPAISSIGDLLNLLRHQNNDIAVIAMSVLNGLADERVFTCQFTSDRSLYDKIERIILSDRTSPEEASNLLGFLAKIHPTTVPEFFGSADLLNRSAFLLEHFIGKRDFRRAGNIAGLLCLWEANSAYDRSVKPAEIDSVCQNLLYCLKHNSIPTESQDDIEILKVAICGMIGNMMTGPGREQNFKLVTRGTWQLLYFLATDRRCRLDLANNILEKYNHMKDVDLMSRSSRMAYTPDHDYFAQQTGIFAADSTPFNMRKGFVVAPAPALDIPPIDSITTYKTNGKPIQLIEHPRENIAWPTIEKVIRTHIARIRMSSNNPRQYSRAKRSRPETEAPDAAHVSKRPRNALFLSREQIATHRLQGGAAAGAGGTSPGF